MRMRIWLPGLALALVLLVTVVGCGAAAADTRNGGTSVSGTVGRCPAATPNGTA